VAADAEAEDLTYTGGDLNISSGNSLILYGTNSFFSNTGRFRGLGGGGELVNAGKIRWDGSGGETWWGRDTFMRIKPGAVWQMGGHSLSLTAGTLVNSGLMYIDSDTGPYIGGPGEIENDGVLRIMSTGGPSTVVMNSVTTRTSGGNIFECSGGVRINSMHDSGDHLRVILESGATFRKTGPGTLWTVRNRGTAYFNFHDGSTAEIREGELVTGEETKGQWEIRHGGSASWSTLNFRLKIHDDCTMDYWDSVDITTIGPQGELLLGGTNAVLKDSRNSPDGDSRIDSIDTIHGTLSLLNGARLTAPNGLAVGTNATFNFGLHGPGPANALLTVNGDSSVDGTGATLLGGG